MSKHTKGISIWDTAPTQGRWQRAGRYVEESSGHPAKMLPAIAAHAITHYTRPGDWVLDPMCGIGTTLVEALHLGRRAAGVEYEARWAKVAAANTRLASSQVHVPEEALVVNGDARRLTRLLPASLAGQVALVVTSPPYGASTHGRVRTSRESGERGVAKADFTYGPVGPGSGNLAHLGSHRLIDGFTDILRECARLLRPGGHVVVTTRPWRTGVELHDLPGDVAAAGEAAGLVVAERCVALLGGLRGNRLVARPSFFALKNLRHAREQGHPWALIVHEDVIVLRRPASDEVAARADAPWTRDGTPEACP